MARAHPAVPQNARRLDAPCASSTAGGGLANQSSVAVLSEEFTHLCLVLRGDKQGTSAERERGTRLRVLIAKQLDA
jgi:hypothetical protein